MHLAIIEFPGSYGANEMKLCLSSFFDVTLESVHYTSDKIPKCDLLIIPGGSSFCDVFRPGALAKSTRMGHRIRQFAQSGGNVLGIGNGFQLLTELEMLPGGLFPNTEPGMLQDEPYVITKPRTVGLTRFLQADEIYQVPIAGNQARYVISKRQLEDVDKYDGIVLTYCNEEGEVDPSALYNGNTRNIAGITNKEGNVLGTMLRPERLADPIQGSLDGKSLLAGILYALELQ
jgi:phosphoribosylformylglycinamidine synthase